MSFQRKLGFFEKNEEHQAKRDVKEARVIFERQFPDEASKIIQTHKETEQKYKAKITSKKASDQAPSLTKERVLAFFGGKSSKTSKPLPGTTTDEKENKVDPKNCYYPSPDEMKQYQARLDREEKEKSDKKIMIETKQKEARERKLKEEGQQKDDWKPHNDENKWQSRLWTHTALKNRYVDYGGKIYHDCIDNPESKAFHLPPIISRADALHFHSQETIFRLGVTQILELNDELWIKGWTNRSASVSVKILGFYPRFYISVGPMPVVRDGSYKEVFSNNDTNDTNNTKPPKKPTFMDPDTILEILNEESNIPPRFRGLQSRMQNSNKPPLQPVVSCKLVYSKLAVEYQGREEQPFYELSFYDKPSFNHYRSKLSVGEITGLDYTPKLFHEEETLVQMFIGKIQFTYSDWIEAPYEEFRFRDESEWDKIEDLVQQHQEFVQDNPEKYPDSDSEEMETIKSSQKVDNSGTNAKTEKNKSKDSKDESNFNNESKDQIPNEQMIDHELRDLEEEPGRKKKKYNNRSNQYDGIHLMDILGIDSSNHQHPSKNQNQSGEQKHSYHQQKPKLRLPKGSRFVRSKSQLEGAIHYTKLKVHKKNDAPIPIPLWIFDIETLCHKNTQQQLQSGLNPPLIMDDEDIKAQKENHPMYTQVFQRFAAEKQKLEMDEQEGANRMELYPLANKPKDAVIYIASNCMLYGDSQSFVKVIHCLGTPDFEKDDLKDVVVFTFSPDKEKELLEHWSSMMQASHYEILSGYNSIVYDLPYMYRRAQVLNSKRFKANLSSFYANPLDYHDNRQIYNACKCGKRREPTGGDTRQLLDLPILKTPGIVQFDVYKMVKMLAKNLDEYKLSFVAKHYKIDYNKKDMPYKLISPYWIAGSRYFQRKLAIYCHFDVLVTEQIAVKANLMAYAMEVARASFTSIEQQIFQGQQIKIYNTMLKMCATDGWILDEERRKGSQMFYRLETFALRKYQENYLYKDNRELLQRDNGKNKKGGGRGKASYEGATVLEPKVGFYEKWVATMDFASLYPSIMIAFRFCFSTWMPHRYDSFGQIYFELFDRVEIVYDENDDCIDNEDVSGLKNTQNTQNTQTNTNFRKTPRYRAIIAHDQYITWDPENERPTDEEIGKRVLIMTAINHKNKELSCCFVQNRGSFLPNILERLLALRKRVKNQMEQDELMGDKFAASVSNAKQAAIKEICNATYGFTGVKKGMFGFMVIAIATCMMGRMKIYFTKMIAGTFGAEIIYGDTDSVFAIFRHLENQKGKSEAEIELEIRFLSDKICRIVSDRLPKPMKLEFEKLWKRFLMIQKKQYVGLWVWPDPKFYCKGTPNVRRDSCALARTTIERTFRNLLSEPNNRKKLMEPLEEALVKLSNPKISLNELKKTIAKKVEYKNDNLLQVKLFNKLEARRGSSIEEGTRVPFIIALPNGGKRSRLRDDETVTNNAEDVIYALENNIKVDRGYYLRQFDKPLLRFLADTGLLPAHEIKSRVEACKNKIYAQYMGMHKLAFETKPFVDNKLSNTQPTTPLPTTPLAPLGEQITQPTLSTLSTLSPTNLENVKNIENISPTKTVGHKRKIASDIDTHPPKYQKTQVSLNQSTQHITKDQSPPEINNNQTNQQNSSNR